MSHADDAARETGLTLNPKYDANGLITAVATDAATGALLMLAHMNAQALAKTMETRTAWFFSRSRRKLWQKGETSGHVLHVEDIRIDCDQDALWLIVRPDGPACHTGETSCFYRRVTGAGLERIGAGASLCLILLLAGCGPAPHHGGSSGNVATSSGAALEQAAVQSGAIRSGGTVDPAGLFAVSHDVGADRLCVTKAGDGYRFGLVAQFGEQAHCGGHGTLRRAGDALILHFDRSGCEVVVEYDGDRVSLPGVVDKRCDRLCSPHASLAGVSIPRDDSGALDKARDAEGDKLCS